MIASSKTYLADIVKELKTRWPNHRVINIVCHGHSVPAGQYWTPMVDTFNAYPHFLHRKLKERFHWAMINVIVTAFAGENSKKGQERFEQDVLIHRPDVVTIDYGLNDRDITPDETRTYWGLMIEKSLAQDAKVLLLTPTWDISGIDNPKAELWVALQKQADLIRQMADDYSVGLVDSFKEFERYVSQGGDVTDLLSGLNHPNSKGHDIVATAMARYFPIMSIDKSDFDWCEME